MSADNLTQFGLPNDLPSDDSVLGAIADKIDNDFDSDDFSDWGIDGVGPYLTDESGALVIENCNSYLLSYNTSYLDKY